MTRRLLFTIDGMGSGGAERSLAELLPGVEAAGWEPTIACLYRRGRGIEGDLLAGGADLRFLGGSLPAKVAGMRRLVAELRPELVHSTLFQATMVTRLAVRRRAPLVTSLVNTPYDRSRLDGDPNARRGVVRAVQAADRATAGRTARFHAITQAVKDAAVRDLGVAPGRVTVIERGRDPERLGRPSPERTARARAALGIEPSARVVVSVGRLEYQKGQLDLLEAAAVLRGTHPDAVVLVAGRPGAASEELDRVHARLGLGDAVRFLGFRDDLPEVLAAADVFAFPSLFEGLGGVLIEAMALALPIVASDIPAVREVLAPGGNADLVPPRDPARLAGALAALLDDTGRARRYAAASRARFEDRFTLAASTERMLSMYDEVLAATRAGSADG